MIFKKKYVRSQWMTGLLEAEEFIKDGYKHLKNDFQYIWFEHTDVIKVAIPIRHTFRCLGVLDYLDHYENKLKVINENP